MFQNTLTGAALRWFLNLEDSRIPTWEDIANVFYKQYKYNIEVDITRRDLETTKLKTQGIFLNLYHKMEVKGSPNDK